MQEWLECDLDNYAKNLLKQKNTIKLLNEYIISQREKDRYLEAFGKLPDEYPEGSEGHLEYLYPRTKESKEYVTKLTETNETSTHKKPGPKNIRPPVRKIPWKPPNH